MSIAIVILNWNGEKFLKQFLPILIRYTKHPNAKIIVADNASTDSSLALLRNNFPEIRTICLDKNYGFASGYNKALEQIEADYFVLLNSDVEVTPNWLEPIIHYMSLNQDVAACQPKILSYTNKTDFEHAGASGGFIDKYGFPFCRGRILGIVEEDKGQYDEITDIFWASGACMVVRSDAFRKTGGLDDAFFAHMEEIDLCWRMRSRGYRIVCVPESAVYHIGGGTLNVESPFKTYLNFRNNLLMLYKNMPEKQLKKVLFRRLLFDYLAALQLFANGKYANAKSVIKARRDYRKMKPDFSTKRNENILDATTEAIPGILQKSIVLSYFLKGKKTFSSINWQKPQN